jgi:hypothetical protein
MLPSSMLIPLTAKAVLARLEKLYQSFFQDLAATA